jgi:protein arginine kinase activator
MKCQKCTKAATLHITELVTEEQVEELHLCEECAHKYLYSGTQQKPGGTKIAPMGQGDESDEPAMLNRECQVCGLKFVDFRNTGRLGCPHDYQAFREELTPLLENIHGETRHCGKTPRRLPQTKQKESELVVLQKLLLQAVNKEAYEEAAKIRDRIRRLEEN